MTAGFWGDAAAAVDRERDGDAPAPASAGRHRAPAPPQAGVADWGTAEAVPVYPAPTVQGPGGTEGDAAEIVAQMSDEEVEQYLADVLAERPYALTSTARLVMFTVVSGLDFRKKNAVWNEQFHAACVELFARTGNAVKRLLRMR